MRTDVEIKTWAMSVGADCRSCPLKLRHPVEGWGPSDPSFVVVGESPGYVEVQQGRPFIGQSGDLLRQTLEGVNQNPDSVYYTNVVMCNPPANQTPLGAILCCLPRLQAELAPYVAREKLIVAAGKIAADRLGGEERGAVVHTKEYGRVMHVLHPAAILRSSAGFISFSQHIAKAASGAPTVPSISFDVPNDAAEAIHMLAVASDMKEICIDLETDLVDWRENDILCMGIGISEYHAFVIPAWLLAQPDVQDAIRVLFSSGVSIIGQNIMFDLVYLYHHYGISNVRGDQDTMIAHYVLDESSPHGLKEQLLSRFDMEDYEAELVKKYRRTSTTPYSVIPPDKLYEYNAKDVCYNMLLWSILKKELQEEGLWERPYRYPIMASHPTLLGMELRGLPVASDRLGPLDADMEILQHKLEQESFAIAGQPFNPNSPKQVAHIMYDVLKLPIVQVRGKKPRTTCEEARVLILDQIPSTSPGAKFLTVLDEIRSLSKLRSSYVNNMWQWLIDGRVHPHYKLTGTVTGRLSASDPAIQTIPRPGTGEAGGERWGKAIKSIFVAGEGMTFVLSDYSQAELRVAAALSGDEFLVSAYKEGRDIHSETAAEMFGPNFTKEQRGYAKSFNFALIYGGTEHSFAAATGMPIEVARELVGKMTARMPGFVAFRDHLAEVMQDQGYVEYRTGRRRRWPLLTTENMEDMKKAAINSPIQGTASDLNLEAMIEMDLWLARHRDTYPTAQLALTVHDSIGLIVPIHQARTLGTILRNIMEHTASKLFPEVPWKVDVEWGPSWGELEAIEL